MTSKAEHLATQWQQNMDEAILRLPQCDNCQRWNWYPLPVCTGCQQGNFSWIEVPLTATLFSWTRVHRNFTGLDMGPMPYTVGLIEVAGTPAARIPCRFIGENAALLKIGETVTLSFKVLADQQVLCFQQ